MYNFRIHAQNMHFFQKRALFDPLNPVLAKICPKVQHNDPKISLNGTILVEMHIVFHNHRYLFINIGFDSFQATRHILGIQRLGPWGSSRKLPRDLQYFGFLCYNWYFLCPHTLMKHSSCRPPKFKDMTKNLLIQPTSITININFYEKEIVMSCVMLGEINHILAPIPV